MLSFLSGVCIYLTIGILFTIIAEILSLMGKTLNMRQITINNISKLKDNHDKELAKTRINRIIFKTYILLIIIWPVGVYMIIRGCINDAKKKFKK